MVKSSYIDAKGQYSASLNAMKDLNQYVMQHGDLRMYLML